MCLYVSWYSTESVPHDLHPYKFSLVHHYFCWNVPSSDTNKHKENMLEKDIQMYYHQAAEILQFYIIKICFFPLPKKRNRQ